VDGHTQVDQGSRHLFPALLGLLSQFQTSE
jgi:hypothetical protein